MKRNPLDELNLSNDDELKRQELIKIFKPTDKYGNILWFDDENRLFLKPNVEKAGFFKYSSKIDDSYVLNYDDILDYEIIEDGSQIAKGVIGKNLLGGEKAKHLAISKDLNYTQVELNITTKDKNMPLIQFLYNINLIKQGDIYLKLMGIINKLAVKIGFIFAENKNNNQNIDKKRMANESVDLIKKYYDLMISGAISKEEYEKIKNDIISKLL